MHSLYSHKVNVACMLEDKKPLLIGASAFVPDKGTEWHFTRFSVRIHNHVAIRIQARIAGGLNAFRGDIAIDDIRVGVEITLHLR